MSEEEEKNEKKGKVHGDPIVELSE